jgi:hypothetical protein
MRVNLPLRGLVSAAALALLLAIAAGPALADDPTARSAADYGARLEAHIAEAISKMKDFAYFAPECFPMPELVNRCVADSK